MTAEQMKKRIETLAPQTKVEMVDLTGTQDHWQAIIVSAAFEGKSLVDRHKMVFALFKDEVESNEVHALSLKTLTPSQAK
jgi:acid stress-induced BolA-like protein IbaG/YrbA